VRYYCGKALDLSLKPAERPTSLGIGAGGSIVQHIERDQNENPRIWDVASSKVLNVQILDAASFRLVTGLPPPPTPVSAETYAEHGLPFYRMWRDEAKEAGVAGRWADPMGVAAVENLKAKSGGGGIGSAWTGTAGTDEKPQLLETKAWGLREDDEVEGEGWKEPSFDFPMWTG
jgi:hypothetical protein